MRSQFSFENDKDGPGLPPGNMSMSMCETLSSAGRGSPSAPREMGTDLACAGSLGLPEVGNTYFRYTLASFRKAFQYL